MLYTKLNVSWDEYPRKLNRTLYVNDEIALYELAIILCITLRAEFEHCFYFMEGEKSYVMDCFMEDYVRPNDFPLKDFSLKDLGDSFDLIYDNGAYWCFNCKKFEKSAKILNSKSQFQFVEGCGLGIWEDNIIGLCNYIDGKYDANLNRDKVEEILDKLDEDEKYQNLDRNDWAQMFPWNLNIFKLSQWDRNFSKNSEQQYIKRELPCALEIFKDDISTGEQYLKSHWDNHVVALSR